MQYPDTFPSTIAELEIEDFSLDYKVWNDLVSNWFLLGSFSVFIQSCILFDLTIIWQIV